MKRFSSRQVALKLGITGASLSRYIKAGKVPAPEETEAGGMKMRLWTEEQIEQLRELLPKIANGRKTRHAKKQLTIRNKQLVKTQPKAKKPQPRVATATSTAVHTRNQTRRTKP